MKLQVALTLMCLLIIGQSHSADTLYDARFKKWETEASHGDPKAQYSLGNAYLRGNEVERDVKQAISWFEKAAKQGHAKSEYKLGELYYQGNHVKRNHDKAFNWIAKSADHGYPPAQFLLGRMYSKGQGTDQDLEKALNWLQKARIDQFLPVQEEINKVENMRVAARKQVKSEKSEAAYVAPVVQPKETPAATTTTSKVAAKPNAKGQKTYNGIKLLLKGGWKDDSSGEATAYMPSDLNRCEIMHNYYISCSSSRQQITNKFARITYRVVSKFIEFVADGKFVAEYELNVVKVERLNTTDTPGPKDIPKKGLQAKQIAKCRFEDNDKIACVNDDFDRLSYSR